jgi:hypothetical protein
LALVVIFREAVRAPIHRGVKVTASVQLPPAATDPPQLFVWVKSLAFGPVIATDVMFSTAVPEFVSVTDNGTLPFKYTTLPNTSEAGDSITAGALDPVPDSATVCGMVGSPSVMVRVADLAPAAAGVNVTLIVHDANPASDALQEFVCVNSPLFAPVIPMLPIEACAGVGFVTVTVWAALVVPTVVDENVSEAGERVNSTMPVPLSEAE